MNWAVILYAWACERLYKEFAWSYDGVSWLVSLGRWASWRRMALTHLPTPDPTTRLSPRILELGFGTGELLIEMAQRQLIVCGLELAAPMQRVTQRKLARRQLVIPCVRALAQAMPFSGDSFDAIVATFPAPYILQPATLQECARLLRTPTQYQPGGRLVIVGLWVDWESPLLRRLAGVFYGTPNLSFIQQVETRLEAAGFAVTIQEQRDRHVCVGIVVGEKIAHRLSTG